MSILIHICTNVKKNDKIHLGELMNNFILITEDIKNAISNDFFIGLILLSGVYFTIRLVLPQFRFAKQLK